jgi:class 3 adenylate cyclase
MRLLRLRAMVQERPVRVERKLSAILAADVAGYSRLMHNDEEATHAKLTTLLSDAVAPAIADHGGRIVKNTGDGFLAEFPSVVEAVRAAMQFQSRIRELTLRDAKDRRVALRVGINIGDVIVEPHDIFGDGVNIAARLESIAEPGGICISSSAYEYVRGKVGIEFADLGEQNLKNIAFPIRAYAVVREEPSSASHISAQAPRTASAPRLSIVVLPFANLTGDPGQEYFVDGVTESLTTDLSRISGSPSLARTYAAQLIGLLPDVLITSTTINLTAIREATSTVPVVFVLVSDPVAQGFVTSMRRPGGNLTGFSVYEFSIGGKWLDLLKEVAPGLARVAVMFDPDGSPQSTFFLQVIEATASSHGVQATAVPVRTTADIEPALESFARQPNGGLMLTTNAFTLLRNKLIADLAIRYRLPSISGDSDFTRDGGLMDYQAAINFAAQY